MTSGDRDLLQLLANPTNRAILRLLYLEPQYPRRLAELVGLTEDEVSRRLRRLETLGVAQATWTAIGKNVRLYRLTARQFKLEVDESGISIEGLPQGKVALAPAVEAIPQLSNVVNRSAELAELSALLAEGPAVCIVGVGGTGKTTLAAAFCRHSNRPVAWHTLAPGESEALLMGSLAASLRALDTPEQAKRIDAMRGDETTLLTRALAERLDELGALVVLDRCEEAADTAVAAIADLARALTTGRLLLTSRTFPRGLPRDKVARLQLAGLKPAETAQLLASLGAEGSKWAQAVQRQTGGHPLSVVLAGQFAANQRVRLEPQGRDAGIQAFLFEELLPQLSDVERDVLMALSVLRQPFTIEEAERISGSKHASHALLRLEARSLVVRVGESFLLHDLVRAFASDALSDRRAIHQKAAQVLLESGEPGRALEAIHHFLEAGQAERAGAVAYDEAAHRTYRFADLGLQETYRELLDRMARRLDLERKVRPIVELELGAIDTGRGELATARMHLESCQRNLAAAPGLASSLRFALARLLRFEGDVAGALKLYREAQASARQAGDKALLLEALVEHAFLEEERSDQEALALYELAMKVDPPNADPRLLSLLYAGASRVAARWGDDRFASWADEAMQLARVAGYLRGEASVYTNLASHHALAGASQVAFDWATRYLDAANRLGDPWMRCCAITDMGFLQAARGEHQDALRLAQDCATLAATIRSPFYALAAAVLAAEGLNGLGQPQQALARIGTKAGAKARAFPGLQARMLRAQAHSQDLLGNAAEARASLRRSERVVRENRLTDAPTSLYVSVGNASVQAPPRRVKASAKPRHVEMKVFFDCPTCGLVQPYPKSPRQPPLCCGTLMRLRSAAGPRPRLRPRQFARSQTLP